MAKTITEIADFLGLDLNNRAQEKMAKNIYVEYYQLVLSEILGHEFVDKDHFDSYSESKKKIEYKIIFVCNSNSLTISNWNEKEDTILYIGHNVVDDNEHWFYFPKWEYNNIYGKDHMWVYSEKRPNGWGKFVDNNLTGGKSMIPINYLKDDNYTWKKGYMRAREYSLDEIRRLSNISDDEVRNFISYEYSEIESEKENT